MASSGLAAWITPRWVVVVTTCMGGPCGPRVGGVSDPWIMATNVVGWTMRSSREVGDGHVQLVVGLLSDRWPGVGGMGFVWGVCDCEVGVIREAHQGGEEG